MKITYQTNCTAASANEVARLMSGKKKASYRLLVNRIKKQYPDLYSALALNLYNPFKEQTAQTKTHYILVHSGIEYFFEKTA